MKSSKVLLQAASIIVALVITLYFGCARVLYAETQGKKPTQVIKKIEIKGNQRISTTAIRSSIRAREGDPYDPQLVSQDVDAIWSLGFFDNIGVELEDLTDGLRVVFLVTERAVIDEIQFQGNKKIKAKKLKKQIEIKEGDYVKPYLLKLDEDKIKELYIKKCFHRVQVHAESKVVDGKTVVVFNVEEGPKIRIAKITFTGNNNFKRRKLVKQMESRQKHFPAFIFPGRFEQKKFESDIVKVKEFYMNNGWLDVDVGWEITYNEDNTRMFLNIHVKEGERYYVESLRIQGETLFTEEELKEKLKLKEGGPFFLDAVEKDAYQLRLTYGEQGYIAASVKEKHTFSSEGTKVDVSFNIEERDRYYIEKIKISGNNKTRDNVIRRQVTFYPGERLDTEKIRDSQRRLTNTGYFDMESGAPAGFNFEPGSEPNKQNVLIDVKEGRSGMLRFGGGYGANIGAFADISYTDRNFDVFDVERSHLKAGITLSANMTRTDNIYMPSKGYEGESSLEFAGLDVDIAKFKFQTTKYNTLFEIPKWGKHVIAYGGTFGIVEPTSGSEVPIFERFFAGGYGSLRGFQFRGIAPVDEKTGDQVGGEILVVMNTEYLVPIYKDIIRAAVFVDTGKADEKVRDINFDHFRLSTGVGLRLNVPFLGRSTIAIDYGIPVVKEEGDEIQAFSFNFGGGSSF